MRQRFILLLLVSCVSLFADVILLEDSPAYTVFRVDLTSDTVVPEGFSLRSKEGFEVIGCTYRVAIPSCSYVTTYLQNVIWNDCNNLSSGNPAVSLVGGTVSFIRTSIIRGVEFAEIEFIPDRFDVDGRYRRILSAEIVVEHRGNGKIRQPARLYHPTYAKLLKEILVNPGAVFPKDAVYSIEEWESSQGAELLVITYPTFTEELAPWVDWKLFSGMPTLVVDVAAAGSSKSGIKNYIQEAYETWDIPPAFVLFVGDPDNDQVPTWQDWSDPCIGDNEYGCVDGADYYPDVLPGRFACDTESQVETFVAKHLNYEKYPDTTDNWTLRSVGVVREEDCPYDPHGLTDSSYVAAVSYMLDQCDSAGFVSTELFTKCSGDVASTAQPFIQNGCNFVSFRGQGVSDWWEPFGGLQQLNTGEKAHITVSITCAMGGFHSGDSHPCETSTRAGTASAPRGAVAYMGQAAISSNSMERSSLSKHIFEGFFSARINELSAAHTYGKIEMIAEFGPTSDAEYEYTTSTLVGSPEMRAWTAPIVSPDLTYLPAVPLDSVDFEITVFAGGHPVEGARAVVHCDTVFSYAITDSLGYANMDFFTNPGVTPVLVVTGPNLYPFVDTIEVISSGAAIYPAPSLFEELTGNSDGLFNPGETIRLIPHIFNVGLDLATGLSGKLYCPVGVNILDSLSVFPALGTWDTVAGDGFVFELSSYFLATDSFPMWMEVSGHPDGPWSFPIKPSMGVHRFELGLRSFDILDEPLLGGNDDCIANPGETFELAVEFFNSTFAPAINVEALLLESSRLWHIDQSTDIGACLPRDTISIEPRFVISAAPFAYPATYSTDLVLHADCGTYQYDDTFEIEIEVVGSATAASSWLVPTGELFIDDCLGDCDSIAEPGETVLLKFGLANLGSIGADSVNSTAIASPFCTPIYGDSFAAIAIDDTVYNLRGVEVSIPAYAPSDTTIYIPMLASADGGYETWFVLPLLLGEGTAVPEKPAQSRPANFALFAYPNPFNSAVSISLDAPVGEGLRPSRVEIFDLAGRRMAQLPSPSVPLPEREGGNSFSLWEKVAEGRMRAEYIWQPDETTTSGIYLVRARFDSGETSVKRIIYLK